MSDESTPGATPVLAVLDAAGARRWAVVCRAALAAHRGALAAPNVFPVPDAETGTNLDLTFDTALERTWAGAQSVGSLPGAIRETGKHSGGPSTAPSKLPGGFPSPFLGMPGRNSEDRYLRALTLASREEVYSAGQRTFRSTSGVLSSR